MSNPATTYNAGLLLESVSRMRRNALDQVMRPHGVSPSQWWLLKVLREHDGLSQTEVAKRLNMTRVALGELVERLESGGLLQRSSDPSDRRVKRLSLTKAGRGLVDQVQRVDDDMERQIESCFSTEERKALDILLHRLMANLRALDGADGTEQER